MKSESQGAAGPEMASDVWPEGSRLRQLGLLVGKELYNFYCRCLLEALWDSTTSLIPPSRWKYLSKILPASAQESVPAGLGK